MPEPALDSDIRDVLVRLPVGRAIQMRRKRLNLKQVEVADTIGVSQGYVSQLETDTQTPTQTNIEALAEVLQADPDDIRLGRVPLSWFGAVLMDGVLVNTREEAIHALAVFEGVGDDAIQVMVGNVERLTDDDVHLLTAIERLQSMSKEDAFRLLRRQKPHNTDE